MAEHSIQSECKERNKVILLQYIQTFGELLKRKKGKSKFQMRLEEMQKEGHLSKSKFRLKKLDPVRKNLEVSPRFW